MKKISYLLGFGLSTALWAQNITIHNPMVWENLQGVKQTGMFMVIENKDNNDLKLIRAEAGDFNTELHTGYVEDGVNKMRKIPEIQLPANDKTILKPGGLHIMLVNMPQPIQAGQQIPLKLYFEGIDKPVLAEVPVMKRPHSAQTTGHTSQ